MTNRIDDIHAMTFRPTRTRGADQAGYRLFEVKLGNLTTWCQYKIHPIDETDRYNSTYKFVIFDFGLQVAGDAGLPKPNLHKFSTNEVIAVRNRIFEYLTGQEEKNFLPFYLKRHDGDIERGRCLEVEFPEGWISVAP